MFVPQQDLVDSYLPSFQACVEEGKVSGISALEGAHARRAYNSHTHRAPRLQRSNSPRTHPFFRTPPASPLFFFLIE